MRNSSLAVKALALLLSLSLPASASAASLSSQAARSAPGVVFPSAQIKVLMPELQRGLDAHFPAGWSAERSLAGLEDAAVAGPSASQAAALALIARAAQAGPQAAAGALTKAGLPQPLIRQLAAAAEAMNLAAQADPAFARQLNWTRRALEAPATFQAQRRVPALLQRAKSLFGAASPLGEGPLLGVMAAPGGGPGEQHPNGLGNPGALTAVSKAPASEMPAAGQIPSSKKVSELLALVKRDADAGYAEAERILADKAEKRVEVRVSALRLLQEMPGPRPVAVFMSLLKEEPNWYLRREAIRGLGLRAASVAEGRDAVVAGLKEAYTSPNDSLRLMSKWSLQQYGVEPGPEPQTGSDGLKGTAAQAAAPLRHLQGPGAPKGPNIFKSLILGVMIIWFAFLATTVFNASRSRPDSRPAITQVQQGSRETTISAAPGAGNAQAAPRDEKAALSEIAAQSKRTADSVETLTKALVKAQPPAQTTGGMIMGIVIQVAIFIGIMFLVTWILGKMRGGGGFGAGAVKGQLSQLKNRMEQTETRFSDVAGIDDAMGEIQEIVDYLRNPMKYRKLGGRVPKGVLLEGPPGTGKTLLARALATESGAKFISVSGSDFIEMFVGVGASRVRQLFTVAKENPPAIIFIDELDAVAKRRDGAKFSGGNDEREQTVNAILTEMGGFDNSTGVIVIAATNRSDVLDPAITRPGRFDRKIHVGLPDVLGREAILQVHARRARLSPEADLRFIAQRTAGLSGAFLENIVNEAALLAARRGADSVSMADLNEAVDRNTIGAKRNLFVPAQLKRRITVHEVGHVIAGMRSGGKRPNKVTNIPHGSQALGFAEPGGDDDRYLYTQPELEARLVGILGGLAAEKMLYGNTSTGPDNDLEQATRIARMMVERLGMSELVGYVQTSPDPDNPLAGRRVSEQTAREIDQEVKRIVGAAQAKAAQILTEDREAFDAVVEELMVRETLSGEEIERILTEKAAAKP